MRTKEEKFNVIIKAKDILDNRKELFSINRNEILDYLDDGSEEMRKVRWGVLAYLYIYEIKEFDYKNIIQKLAEIRDKKLTFEYIGFILQIEYKISLMKLVIEAEELNLFSDIIPFVCDNIINEDDSLSFYLETFMDVVYKNKGYNNYYTLLKNLDRLITESNNEEFVLSKFYSSENEIYYDLVESISGNYYLKNLEAADTVILNSLNKGSTMFKKIAIIYLNISVLHHDNIFTDNFIVFDNLASEDAEYWKMLIPSYVTCFTIIPNNIIRKSILARLDSIMEGSIDEKRIFLRQLYDMPKLLPELKRIFETIVLKPFDKDSDILFSLNVVFSNSIKSKTVDKVSVLQQLNIIFCQNKFSISNCDDFFKELYLTFMEIKNEEEVFINYIFDNIISGSSEELFFSISALDKLIHLDEIPNKLRDKKYSWQSVLAIMEGFLYFIFEAKKVCLLAFQLVKIIDGATGPYETFCKEYIYKNYPYTFFKVANEVSKDENRNVRKLSKIIVKLHQETECVKQEGYKIPDLEPSFERNYLYHRAKLEQNKKINEMTEAQSVTRVLFSKEVLKYGKRIAYIRFDRKNHYSFQISNFSEIRYEMEMPNMFMTDPVLLASLKTKYLRDRGADSEISD